MGRCLVHAWYVVGDCKICYWLWQLGLVCLVCRRCGVGKQLVCRGLLNIVNVGCLVHGRLWSVTFVCILRVGYVLGVDRVMYI